MKPGEPWGTVPDEMLTIRPSPASRIAGVTATAQRYEPVTLTWITRFHSS